MKKCVYTGSFDPVTKGHMAVIEKGSELFDELVVAIGTHPEKKGFFPLEERHEMLRRSTRKFPNVTIDSCDKQILIRYAKSIGAGFILRGVRTGGDYEYERGLMNINSDIEPEITTLFLMSPRPMSEVSSSMVRGFIGYDSWEKDVERYVPKPVYNHFLVKFNGFQKRWNSLWSQIGAKENPQEAYEELLRLYGDAERYYHNFVHIAHSLRFMDEARNLIKKPEEAEIALWYHDAIYNTHEKDNEEKSAELAERRLSKAGLKKDFIDNVSALILATKHQEIPREKDAQYITDIDLTPLGRPWDEFEEDRRDIRDEYGWVTDDQFRDGRSGFLKSFLGRERIYSTELFGRKYEAQAQDNLKKSLMFLKGQA